MQNRTEINLRLELRNVYFIGYPKESRACFFNSVENHKVYMSRNVVFFENKFSMDTTSRQLRKKYKLLKYNNGEESSVDLIPSMNASVAPLESGNAKSCISTYHHCPT